MERTNQGHHKLTKEPKPNNKINNLKQHQSGTNTTQVHNLKK